MRRSAVAIVAALRLVPQALLRGAGPKTVLDESAQRSKRSWPSRVEEDPP